MSSTSQLPIESIADSASRLPDPGAKDVSIEVLNESIGDQIQIERLPWHALVYDADRRVLELSVGARGRNLDILFRHEIHDPVTVWVEEEAGSVKSMRIEHEDGTQTIVRFFDRPALAAGH